MDACQSIQFAASHVTRDIGGAAWSGGLDETGGPAQNDRLRMVTTYVFEIGKLTECPW